MVVLEWVWVLFIFLNVGLGPTKYVAKSGQAFNVHCKKI